MADAHSASPASPCPVCDCGLREDRFEVWRCDYCGFFLSQFPVQINSANDALDEELRIKALSPIRRQNAAVMLDRLRQLGFPTNATILDIGCGHGWFLDEARKRGFKTAGIEPDRHIADIAQSGGHDVTAGFFPDCLPADARFDAIVFNDVFEHLPDINGIVAALRRHTAEGAWIVINLPVSDGIFFRLGRMLAKAGLATPYRRLWQYGMPSPHLSYFSERNIRLLMEKHGFDHVGAGSLEAITTAGLLERVQYDRSLSRVSGYLFWIATLAIAPMLRWLPPDIQFFAFRKRRP